MCAASIHRLKPHPFAEEAHDPWLEARIRNAPLFDLPWEGNDELRPIRTTRVLKDAADIFQNDMWERLDWFVDGQEACYLWTGIVKAAVTLRTDPLYGWSVREVTGVGGKPLPAPVERSILDQLAAAGFRRRGASFPL